MFQSNIWPKSRFALSRQKKLKIELYVIILRERVVKG
jgi:hypothetical protein